MSEKKLKKNSQVSTEKYYDLDEYESEEEVSTRKTTTKNSSKSKDKDREEEEDIDDTELQSIINGTTRVISVPLIFSVTFSDAETLKQLFVYLNSTVDKCPFKFKKDSISIFKAKKSDINQDSPSMLINIKIDCEELYDYRLNMEKASNKSENFSGFVVKTSQLSSLTKNTKINSIINISQHEGENFLRCMIRTDGSCSYLNIAIDKYVGEVCDLSRSRIIQSNLKPICKPILNHFTTHCTNLTKTKKIQAAVHFEMYKSGMKVYSDNTENQEKFWGDITGPKHEFVFKPLLIKNLACMKKFNIRGIVKFYCVDDQIIRMDTSISTFGYANIYLIQKNSS